jgi:phosphoribosylaminoimidazolecarboxamide formyltransferase/IMP cyclohydrolase
MSAPTHDPALYRTRDLIPIKRALVSVSDKTGVVELASALAGANVEIVSTGSTGAAIRAAGIPVTDVTAVTGFPENLDGRVKTLHPAVHSGLLADLRLESQEKELAGLGIAPFELVVCNLYPFSQTVAAGASENDTVEQIDIGGPAMVRAAAKNYANVAVVVSPEDYDVARAALASGGTTLTQRKKLALAAFRHTASYDIAVAGWIGRSVAPDDEGTTLPGWLGMAWDRAAILRYGENSHQQGALYTTSAGAPGIAQSEQLHGKAMSYNNYVDADRALRAAYDFDGTAVAVVKHANPCGIAIADTIAEAHRKAHACDPVSAYGGVIAANRPVTLEMAQTVKGIFTEVIVAPDYEEEALRLLETKKNLRILRLPEGYARGPHDFKQISGGLLVQTSDTFEGFSSAGWKLVAGEEADPAMRADLEFAWKACRSVKSNAILLAHDGASVGVGMGQVNRVDSCALAVRRAGERANGSVAASDAFFPFADGEPVGPPPGW